MCGAVGSGSCVEEGQGDGGDDDDEAESEPVPSFTEALRALESVRAFIYAHNITERDYFAFYMEFLKVKTNC
jgi:hypothetical protein